MSNKIQLGKDALYPDQYDSSLLEPIPRRMSRDSLFGENACLPFTGIDIWTAYELSWLDRRGKPHVALGEFEFPSNSDNIVESKSFKYYLNSFNQTHFDSTDEVLARLKADLHKACGLPLNIRLYDLSECFEVEKFAGQCVDDIELDIEVYEPDAKLLQCGAGTVEGQQLFSHLLKSNCPVTGQPDWASVWVEYSGREIDPASFLRYVVSFRQHQDFHENCVEHIFQDILNQCQPERLSVYARYTRRGGLDINPFRSNCEREIPFRRVIRQ